jgi:hypothetical protein
MIRTVLAIKWVYSVVICDGIKILLGQGVFWVNSKVGECLVVVLI